MAQVMNRQLFNNQHTTNHAGGKAYQLSPKQALAQLVCTGTLHRTFYANAEEQLSKLIDLAKQMDNEFLAKLALYAKHNALMKDTPILLLAILCIKTNGQPFAKLIFKDIIHDGKSLRNFVQVMRSGVIGRKSLGSFTKKLVNDWLIGASDKAFINTNIGNKPTLKDVIRLSHPKPVDNRTQALICWALDKEYNKAHLPELAKTLIDFQKDNTKPLPNLPIQWLMSLDLTCEHWVQIAKNSSWQTMRQNLNTFARHGVFQTDGMAELIAQKLADGTTIKNSKIFPYQLYATWSALDDNVPDIVKNALKIAMNHALANVPVLQGNIAIAVDVSGSMISPVTGYRRGATTQIRCVDVASLFAAAMKVANPTAIIMPFDTDLRHVPSLNDRRSTQTGSLIERTKAIFSKPSDKPNLDVFNLAKELARLGGGGTNTALPLAKLNRQNSKIDVMIYFSDNESWADEQHNKGTQMMKEWQILKQRCPNAKLICVDVQPYTTSQAKNHDDVLNVGGFSDNVFSVIELFCLQNNDKDFWIQKIEQIQLESK